MPDLGSGADRRVRRDVGRGVDANAGIAGGQTLSCSVETTLGVSTTRGSSAGSM
jgi:hypothetical protein